MLQVGLGQPVAVPSGAEIAAAAATQLWGIEVRSKCLIRSRPALLCGGLYLRRAAGAGLLVGASSS